MSSEVFLELYRKEIKRKIEQKTEGGIPASLGTELFHGSVGQGWEVVQKYIEPQDTHHAKSIAIGLVH